MQELHSYQSRIVTISNDKGRDPDKPLARIHVVGANRSLNQSLVVMLEMAFGAWCTCDDGLTLTEDVDFDSVNPIILLIDCLTLDEQEIENQIQTRMNILPNESKIILFNAAHNHEYDNNTYWAMVQGIFYQDDSKALFLKGMDAILDGLSWFTRCGGKRSADKFHLNWKSASPIESHALSKREIEILKHIGSGMSNSRIAGKLRISPHTVKSHVYNIFKKIAVPNRLQAAIWAMGNL